MPKRKIVPRTARKKRKLIKKTTALQKALQMEQARLERREGYPPLPKAVPRPKKGLTPLGWALLSAGVTAAGLILHYLITGRPLILLWF